MSLSFKTFLEFAKQEKTRAIESDGPKDMLPQIFVVKNDEILAVVTVPKLDENLTFRASFLLHIAFQPDELIVNLDANLKLKEDHESLLEDMTECIIVHKIDKNGKCAVAALPYINHESSIKWIKEGFTVFEEGDEDQTMLDGKIIKTLKKIVSSESIFKNKDFKKFASSEILKKHGVKSDEHLAFTTSRAVLGVLIEMGYHVVDMYSHQHIEWTDAKNKAKNFVDLLIEKNQLDESNREKLIEVLCQYVGTPVFVEKAEHYLSLYLKEEPKNTTYLEMAKSLLFHCMSPV